MSAGREPRARTIGRVMIAATVALLSLGTTTVQGLTGTHQVIVAYYPIFPRWYTTQNCLWIGDPVHQYPLLGLYNNRTDAGVITFDFGCMKNMGATVVNPHFFGTTVDTDRCNRINSAAAAVGLMWTPTFEAFTGDPAALANITNTFMALYGSSPNLMRVDNRPVMFWHLHGGSVTESSIADAVEIVRAASGEIMIILDSIGLGQCCQWIGNGNGTISPLFMEPDGTTGYQRINGFYSWVPAYWCMFSPSTRRTYVNNYVIKCVNNNMLPVLSTSPSDNEENWGYECDDGIPPTENCGVGGQRCYNPYYNPTRDVTEWESNLND